MPASVERVVGERLERRRVDLAAEVRDDLGRGAGPGRARSPRAPPPAPTRRRRRAGVSPARRAPSATASVPDTGRMRPSSASSPTAACSASRSGGSCRVAPSTASEIGRSNPEPSLRSAAGARLTVIRRLSGHSSDSRDDAAADAVLRLLAGAVGEPDDREPRDAGLEVGLDLDLARLEADESVGDRACEHPRHGRREGVTQG